MGDLTNAANRTLLTLLDHFGGRGGGGFQEAVRQVSRIPVRCCRACVRSRSSAASAQFRAPLGTWYDALQVKVTKRFSHGLTATMAYTFSKALDNSTNAGSIYDRNSFKGLSAPTFPTSSASASITRCRRLAS